MSRTLALVHPETRQCYTVETFTDGGVYAIGGGTETNLNVTYNYSVMFPFSTLGEMTAQGSIPLFEEFLEKWGHVKPYKADYWAPTPGNVAAAVRRLHAWAVQFPDGVWEDWG